MVRVSDGVGGSVGVGVGVFVAVSARCSVIARVIA